MTYVLTLTVSPRSRTSGFRVFRSTPRMMTSQIGCSHGVRAGKLNRAVTPQSGSIHEVLEGLLMDIRLFPLPTVTLWL